MPCTEKLGPTLLCVDVQLVCRELGVSKTEQRIAQQSPKLRCQDSNGASSQVLSFRLKKADTSNLAPGTRSGEGLDSTAFIRNKELSEGYIP